MVIWRMEGIVHYFSSWIVTVSLLVNQPTTDNGNLIDHIYIRNTTSLNTNIEVHDAYYSVY